MKEYGIRQAKAHLSQIVRAAADGERSLVTDNRKPVAMIGPLPDHGVEAETRAQARRGDETALRRGGVSQSASQRAVSARTRLLTKR